MTRLHEQFDGDRVEINPVAEYRSTVNQYEIPCSVCERPLYIGHDTWIEVQRGIERGLENTLTCDECERTYDSLAFE